MKKIFSALLAVILCAAVIGPGARFCGVCGAKTDEYEDQAEVQK